MLARYSQFPKNRQSQHPASHYGYEKRRPFDFRSFLLRAFQTPFSLALGVEEGAKPELLGKRIRFKDEGQPAQMWRELSP